MSEGSYVVIDTDYNTHNFGDLKDAEEFYLEKCEEALRDSYRLDGNIKLLSVMVEFSKEHVENIIEVGLKKIESHFPRNIPSQGN